jgi:WbqC-like protein family.
MIVSIMQPAYLPWPGYFHRIMSSDLHIVLDHVAIDCNSKTKFTNRNRIRTPQGFTWLTIPLRGGSSRKYIDAIFTAEESNWRRKQLRTLDQFYAKAPFFRAHRRWLEPLLMAQTDSLLQSIQPISEKLCAELGIATPCLRASSLGVTSAKSGLILDLCLAVGATTYLSGPFGRTYLDIGAFAARGIRVLFHDYAPQPYRQCFKDFVPALSVVDMLFNHGPETPELIRSGQQASFAEE